MLNPVDHILITQSARAADYAQAIYGGYANASGAISLFGDGLAYRLNLKSRTIQQKPLLNAGAQARYDAARPGETFQFCGVSFRRLSHAEIAEICASGSFRMGARC